MALNLPVNPACASNSPAIFKAGCVPEYARTFLNENGTSYDYEDLFKIAEGQLKIEKEVSNAVPLSQQFLFIDTDLQVIRIWSEFVFNKCDNRILNFIAEKKYDLYLLCNIDQPWVKDELREYPDFKTREKLYQYYKETLVSQSIPWIEITGNYEERLKNAINACEQIR